MLARDEEKEGLGGGGGKAGGGKGGGGDEAVSVRFFALHWVEGGEGEGGGVAAAA